MKSLLVLVFVIASLTAPSLMFSGDPQIWREEGIAILTHQHLWVPDSVGARAGEPGQYFVLNARDHHYYSKFGVMNGLFCVPPLAAEWLVTGQLPSKAAPTRLYFLLGWQILLTVVLAAVLWQVAVTYADSEGLRRIFVISVLFATCLWFYLRCQSAELWQAILFTLAFLGLVRGRAAPGRGQAWLAVCWISVTALVLSRLSYVLLVPIVGCALLTDSRRSRAARVAAATIPAALIALLVLCVNWSKFGSPWLTGYHQWRPEIHRWNGQFSDGVVGFLLDPQRSVFLYFPPLVGALLAFKTFARRHAFEATLIAVTFLIFLIALGMLPSWRGERSYGPRYLMFLLPVASVPCLALPEWARTWSSHARLFGRAAIALVLGLSVWLQLQVNRLDFFAFYQVRDPIQSVLSDDARAYLANTPFGSINYDLVRYSDHPENLPYVRSLMESSMDDPAKASYLATLSQVAAQRNYLWPFMRGP